MHSFCRGCAEQAVKQGGGSFACPGCSHKEVGKEGLVRDGEAEQQLDGLTVACPNRERGCFWARTRDKLETHLERTCKHMERACKHGCGFEGKGAGLRTHEEQCAAGKKLARSSEKLETPTTPGRPRANTADNAQRLASPRLASPRRGSNMQEMLLVLGELESLFAKKQMAHAAEREKLLAKADEAERRAASSEEETRRGQEELAALRRQLEAANKEIAALQQRIAALETPPDLPRRREQHDDAAARQKELQQKQQKEKEEREREEQAEEERRRKRREEAEERRKKEAEEEENRRKQEEEEVEARRRRRREEKEKRQKEEAELAAAVEAVEAEKAKRLQHAEEEAAAAAAKEKEKEKEKEEMAARRSEAKQEEAAGGRESHVEHLRMLKEQAVEHEKNQKEPPLPQRRTVGAVKKSMRKASIAEIPELSEHAKRALLLLCTEKLKGDSDLKADMPLTNIPEPRLLLLLRSGVLLGKVVARLYPGKFDPLCLRTKGGEQSWNQNLTYVWETCKFLQSDLKEAMIADVSQASYAALYLIVRDALMPRARSLCKNILGDKADIWPLSKVLHAWVLAQSSPEADYEKLREEDVPAPSAAQLCDALYGCGAVRRSHADAGGLPSLPDVLKGTSLEGAVEGPEPADDTQTELLLLWGVSVSSAKSKLRSSVIKAAGSDTSWLKKAQEKK